MVDIQYPNFAKDRGPGFWLRAANIWAARSKNIRADYSNDWRYTFGESSSISRSVSIEKLLEYKEKDPKGFRFLIIGDTGEGDRSQYGFIPVIRNLKPDFMIINGDVAYPSGRAGSWDRDDDDYVAGLFEPYKNLRIPIWATPGNHEYYSPHDGKEFYEVFCGTQHDRCWNDFGLVHKVLQPGTYWELREEQRKPGLVVIGLDSGKKGNLDGISIWERLSRVSNFFDQSADSKQHDWFESRLRIAEERKDKVIVLFHIPSLVREEHDKEILLQKVHQYIAKYPCVKLVVCGHEHNYQHYRAETFQRYLNENHDTGKAQSSPPYIVMGNGGAYLSNTNFPNGHYPSLRYPNIEQWNEAIAQGRQIVSSIGLEKTLVGQLAGKLEKAALDDGDVARFLSLLLVEVKYDTDPAITITPIFMDDLKNLFDPQSNQTVRVNDENLKIYPVYLERCYRRDLAIQC